MILNLDTVPDELKLDGDPEPGEIYQNNRGSLLLVVAIRGYTAYYLRYDPTGIPTGAGQTGMSYLGRQKPVGRVELPTLDVEWLL